MQETDFDFKEMLFCALRQWRKIIVLAIICALLVGAFTAVSRARLINDEEAIERWQTQYEIEYGTYWAEIYDIDRQISANERLASQAELSIEKLGLEKTAHEGRIEDLEAKIVYYEALIEDYKANIEELRVERDKLNYYLTYRKEQNENSLLMAIDPYNVNVYEVYLRVDSGYEILPGSSVQNVDPTPEILQTYRLLVSNTSFYDKMISDLKLDTEVRYLTEVIMVSNYSTNSLRVRIISDSNSWAKMVGEYVSDSILGAHEHVSGSIKEHDITKYNTTDYSVVDLDIYAKQQTFIQQAINYESSIRDVDTSILNTEASIRNMNTDIRTFRQQIEDTNLAITELPIKEQALLDKIGGYRDANFEFQTEKLELLKKPEPKYRGYTIVSVFTGFVKFAVIGGIAGAIISALYLAFAGTLSGKVLSYDKLCSTINSKFFGFWPKKSKKHFIFIDKWIARLEGNSAKGVTDTVATDLVLSNIAVACADSKKLLLCGGASEKTISAVSEAIKERMPSVELITGGTIGFDPAVVRGLAECDTVILVEQLDKSGMKYAVQLKDRAKAMGKPVLGVVLS